MAASQWLRLAHQTAIVTGAGSGIGSAVARSLASEGCNVILSDVDKESIERVASSCQDIHHDLVTREVVQSSMMAAPIRTAKTVECDVTDAGQIRKMICVADDVAARALSAVWKASSGDTKPTESSQWGGKERNHAAETMAALPPVASILINCAGITLDALISSMTEQDFDRVIDVNLKGTFLSCKYFCEPERLAALDGGSNPGGKRGSIVNIGSIVSEQGNIGQANYAASKGGVVGLTRGLAKEMARRGVRVNAVLPGFIDTPMAQAVPDHIKERITSSKIPLRRFGKPDDIANLVLFLSSSERSGYVTGECIECSGMISL